MKNDPPETSPQRGNAGREKPRRSALQQATAYLARGLVPEAKLRAYLAHKHYEEQEIEAAVTALREGGYLREGELALSRTRSLVEQRSYWGRALGAKLKQDGFAAASIDRALAWTGENFEVGELARAALERRYGENWLAVPPRRMAGFLERHGFPTGVIAALLQEARRRGSGGAK